MDKNRTKLEEKILYAADNFCNKFMTAMDLSSWTSFYNIDQPNEINRQATCHFRRETEGEAKCYAAKLNQLYKEYLYAGGTKKSFLDICSDDEICGTNAFDYFQEEFPWLTEDDILYLDERKN